MDETTRDPIALGKAVIIMVFIWLGVDAIYALGSAYEVITLGGLASDEAMTTEITPPAVAGVDMVVGLIALAFLLVNIATVIMSARWIYRVNKNAHSLSDMMTITPGWNIGWFFVPFATLYKPFQGLRESWQTSIDPDDPTNVAVPDWMRWWWGLWLATSILGNISFRVSMSATTVDGQMTAHAIDAFSLLIDVPLAFLFVRLIRSLSHIQAAALNRHVFA